MTPEEIAAELRALADRIDGGLGAYVPGEAAPAGDPDRLRWEARVRGWKKSRFWNVMWGPSPDQPGCWAPITLVAGK